MIFDFKIKKGRLFSTIVLFSFIAACSTSEEPDELFNEAKPTTDSILEFDTLLNAYTPLETDTLEVFSLNNIETDGYLYKGIELSERELIRFPEEYFAEKSTGMGVYACFRFAIDENTTGLITRVPAEYEASDLHLFLYDKETKKISDCGNLARSFGDGGDVNILNSWIIQQGRTKVVYSAEIYQHYNWVDDTSDETVTTEKTFTKMVLPQCVLVPADSNLLIRLSAKK